MKKKLSIKFLDFSLVLCLTFSSFISSYSNAYIARANEEVDLVCDVMLLILTVGGMLVSGGTATPILAAASIAEAAKVNGELIDYFTNNGDGTATIKADDIQMIADIAQASNGFGDSYYDRIGTQGSYNYYGALSITRHYDGWTKYERGSGRFTSQNPIVCFLNNDITSYTTTYTCNYLEIEPIGITSENKFPTFGYFVNSNVGKYTPYNTTNLGWTPSSPDQTGFFTSNAPVFQKKSDALQYIKDGSNAKDALNYNPELNLDFRYGSNYSPTYNGGDFTFNLNQLNNFTNYYTQVINTYPGNDDTDKVLQILLDYIKGDSYDLSLSRADNNVLTEGGQNTIDVEILTNIEIPDYNAYMTWHGIGIDSVVYSGNTATLSLSSGIHGGTYDLSAVYNDNDGIYIISPNLTLTVKEQETLPPETEPPEQETEVTDSIKESNSWLQKIYIRLGEFKEQAKQQFDDILKSMKDGFDSVVSELKKIKGWTALDTLLDGAGVVSDWVQFLTDLLDPAKQLDTLTDFVNTGMEALNGVTDLVNTKFPFCIPVDILVLMQTLSHDPEIPKFEIPFVIERYGINEKVVIDLKDFQIVSDISRTFLSILWCCALMNFTTKITDMKGI